MLDAVGLGDRLDSDIRQLSMGQRQRVAVARALVNEPDLLFADEPTASLDAESGKATTELLHHLAKQLGKTVVVVTHDPRILDYADRVLHLEGGRLNESTSGESEQGVAGILDLSIDSGLPQYPGADAAR